MSAELYAIIATFMVIIGGIAGLYYKLGSVTAITDSNVVRIQRLEDRDYNKR